MSSILTYLTDAAVRDGVRTINGKTLTRPVLSVTDGRNLTYAVDVDIGEEQALRNVPIAPANNALVYADVGCAVTLTRSDSGRWEVTGFSKTAPGTYTRVAVAVPEWSFGIPRYTVGLPENVGLSARPLTYGELAVYGGYGVVPYGAVAVFRGATLLEIR